LFVVRKIKRKKRSDIFGGRGRERKSRKKREKGEINTHERAISGEKRETVLPPFPGLRSIPDTKKKEEKKEPWGKLLA